MIKSARHTVAIRTIAAAALVALAAPSAPALAQAFPSRPITIHSSVAAGASYEILLRTVAEDWQARTGATLIVNPMPGGLGTLAPASLLRSPADGQTVALIFAAPLTLTPQSMKTPPYDPIKDLAPVTMLTRHGLTYLANPQFQPNNVAELIAFARANPGKVTVGYAGGGSQAHMLQISSATGVTFLGVPYKSSAAFMQGLLAGEINIAIQTPGDALELLKSGKVKGLFIGSRNRSAKMPNVQSITETYPDLEGVSWFGVVARAGTPRDRIDWLNREFNLSVKTPRVQAQIDQMAYDTVAGSPDDMAEIIRKEIAVYTKIVKDYNIKID